MEARVCVVDEEGLGKGCMRRSGLSFDNSDSSADSRDCVSWSCDMRLVLLWMGEHRNSPFHEVPCYLIRVTNIDVQVPVLGSDYGGEVSGRTYFVSDGRVAGFVTLGDKSLGHAVPAILFRLPEFTLLLCLLDEKVPLANEGRYGVCLSHQLSRIGQCRARQSQNLACNLSFRT